ncbi:MAG: cbb3-type cytochrome oxidase assembly protein CcoS [candidate division Zixibacteria bacterium]|nr:cbb3-type cytochrome oxidase assembly protein CcoS [candidate division Zixibacteria bacterium]
MYVIVILLGASLLVATGFLLAFWWAVRSGQYDDTYTPALRVLFEEKSVPTDTENTTKPSSEIQHGG